MRAIPLLSSCPITRGAKLMRSTFRSLVKLTGVFFLVSSTAIVAGTPQVNTGLGPKLSDASRRGVRSEVMRLIEAGAPIDFRDQSSDMSDENRRGGTALIYAAFHGDLDLVKWLLDHRADPNATDESGETPLSSAVRSGELDIVSLLLARGSKVENDHRQKMSSYPLILIAARGDQGAILDILRQYGADVNRIGMVRESGRPTTPLAQASENAGPTMVKQLLDAGADPNLEPKDKDIAGSTPLTAAVGAKKPRNVALLLSRGANPNQLGYNFDLGTRSFPLVVAVSVRDLDEIRQLLKAKPTARAITDALGRARNNWNGVQPEDADIIDLLEKARSQTLN